MTDEKTILAMHQYARPSGSATEQAFVDRFLTPLGFKRDTHRNLVLELSDEDGRSANVLFSSHVDTVARREGMMTLERDGDMLRLAADDLAAGFTCLGADDTAGIWLMTEMVKAGVPGLYIIHHAEESGCIGSGALAATSPGFFEGIDMAVAFDRMGYGDVITHQAHGRTASDEFALSLAKALGGSYAPSAKGVYTDTNEYERIIPECTNVSVGYFDQHTARECLDVPFLIRLRDQLLTVAWDNLSISRDPEEVTFSQHPFDDWGNGGGADMETLVRQYPEVAAQMLAAYGVTEQELAEEISFHTGRLVGCGYGGAF